MKGVATLSKVDSGYFFFLFVRLFLQFSTDLATSPGLDPKGREAGKFPLSNSLIVMVKQEWMNQLNSSMRNFLQEAGAHMLDTRCADVQMCNDER